ncbi:hypothetical protein JHK82_057110 [Glycine max]|nr:hypothetical protein JHK82_057110 [Glycine max]
MGAMKIILHKRQTVVTAGEDAIVPEHKSGVEALMPKLRQSVGQGLNKPAEVTLLNLRRFSKRIGHQYMEGPKIEKYK